MATYQLISSVTVGSGGASSIDFTSIPATYTDLVLKLSTRTNNSGTSDNLKISLNGSTSSFTYRILYGTGSAAGSLSGSNNTNVVQTSGDTATASTFGNGEIYIPNYAGSNNKSISADGSGETNATGINQGLYAGLWSNTAAINQITISPNNGTTLLQHSTAYLYGIKNS